MLEKLKEKLKNLRKRKPKHYRMVCKMGKISFRTNKTEVERSAINKIKILPRINNRLNY